MDNNAIEAQADRILDNLYLLSEEGSILELVDMLYNKKIMDELFCGKFTQAERSDIINMTYYKIMGLG